MALCAWSMLWLSEAKDLCKTAALLGVYFKWERLPTRSPAFLWDALTLPFALLFISASCAFIDRNPPFFAFSSCFHFPKSIYEGNFGCGYLKERRASGLVFCENTTSVYRALFVSSPVFFLPFVLMETARMWAGTSNAIYSVVEWCGMRF